jgi:hypothetical protein
MTKALLALPLAMLVLSATSIKEENFLQSLVGSWQGAGRVRLNPTVGAVPVTCTLNSHSTGTTLTLDGNCRARIVFSRRIGVDLRAQGSTYTGSYTGSKRGAARLLGKRSGDTLSLQIKWPDHGEGARVASMQLSSARLGEMRIVTTEQHPQTGARVVTANIEFSRN